VRAQLRRKQFEDENRRIREELLRTELEVAEARATHELAEARALHIGELEGKNAQLRREIAERLKAEEQLRQAQKMEAIGQLTGGIAHDFNNLLTSVLGNIDLALRRADADVAKLLRGALKSAERGARLTSQLLAFGRRQPLRVRAIDLNALVLGLQDMLAVTMTPAVSIELSLAPDLWPALGDPTQIELALINLALNARDAMPIGGQLRIETRNIDRSDPDQPDDLADGTGEHVAFVVSDTGTGMSEEVRAHAFEPFFTTKDVGRGTGLGLSMVYGLAKQLGGTARIASRPGHGTSVAVYVPRTAAIATEPAAAVPDDSSELLSGINGEVLLVDDDDDVRELASLALRRVGFRVIEVGSGHAALAVIDSGEKIDVLVTDVVMPGMHGSVLAAEVRRRHPSLPVMLITGYPGMDRGQGPGEPGLPLLRKPFRPAELTAMVLACRHGPGAPQA
jgi:signal transduction histidine kinase